MTGRARLKDITFITIARNLAVLSTCPRKAVGALIVRDGRCISWGYNGAPPGQRHCDENFHGWQPNTATEVAMMEESFGIDYMDRLGCRNATHAEANALAFAAREGISTAGGTLYVTLSPCETCARLLIAAGIERLVFEELYRDPAGVELLGRAGVDVDQ